MIEGQSDSTGPEGLTVESAGDVLAGMLSKEKGTPAESQPSKKQKAEPAKPAEAEAVEPTETEEVESVEAEGEDTEPEEEPEQPTYAVKIDGVEETVTLDELLKGYGFNKHNTQKAQANADAQKKLLTERQTFESEAKAAREERQQLAATLRELERIVKEQEPDEPDWEALRAEDPENYRDIRDRWEIHKDRKAKLAEQRAEAERKASEAHAASYSEYLAAEEEALFAAIPEWKDPEKMKAETAELAAYATGTLGFTPEQVGRIDNSRIMLMLRKAFLYDKGQKAKPTIQNRMEKPIAPAKPGSTSKSKSNPLAESRKRLASDGSIDAAADFLTKVILADKASTKQKE